MKKLLIGAGTVLVALLLALSSPLGASATSNGGVESLSYTNGHWTLTLDSAKASEVKLIKPGQEVACSEHEGKPKNGHPLCDSTVYTFASQAECVMVQIDWTSNVHNSSDPTACRDLLPQPAVLTEVYSWELPNGGTEANVTWPQTLVGTGDLTPTKCEVTYQVDTYVGTRTEIDAVVLDGILTGSAEDSGIISKWHYNAGPKCEVVPPVVVPPVEEPPVVVPPVEPPVVTPPVVVPPVEEPLIPVCEAGEELQPAGDTYVCGPADSAAPPADYVPDSPVVVDVPAVVIPDTPASVTPVAATELAETGVNATALMLSAVGSLLAGGIAFLFGRRARRRSMRTK